MSTKARARVVVDTNALISRLLLPRSIPGQAVRKAVADCQLLASDATIMELADVLGRPKFDPYVTIGSARTSCVYSTALPTESRSYASYKSAVIQKGDKFLELAVNGTAQLIITGDADLLALHPFRGIEILRPASYLVR